MSTETDGTVLSAAEMKILDNLLEAHDRGGFYMAYQAMFDSYEASLQGRISTFSGLVGEQHLPPTAYCRLLSGVRDIPEFIIYLKLLLIPPLMQSKMI